MRFLPCLRYHLCGLFDGPPFVNQKTRFMTHIIRIALADHSADHLNSIKKIIHQISHFNLIFEAISGAELVEKLHRHPVDVALINFQLPLINGGHSISKMLLSFPQVPIILMALYDNPLVLWNNLNSGANGLLLRQVSREQMQQTVEGVVAKGYYCPEPILAAINQIQNGIGQKVPLLFSDQEKAIIKCICNEMKSAEIAEMLFLSIRTIDWHRSAIKKKIGVQSTIGIVKYAIAHGLAD